MISLYNVMPTLLTQYILADSADTSLIGDLRVYMFTHTVRAYNGITSTVLINWGLYAITFFYREQGSEQERVFKQTGYCYGGDHRVSSTSERRT